MNYRHAYHAGNFADLVKHAVLGAVLAQMTRQADPILIVDTHAGAGLYEFDARPAQASGEAQAGIGRLMAEPAPPPALAALRETVRELNPNGGHRLYPGSPRLIAGRMRLGDRLVACELLSDDAARLRRALAGAKAEVLILDGYAVLSARASPRQRLLALIDPPFERGDDYARAAESARAAFRRNPGAVIVIWLPLKDLETFDGFLRRLEAGGAPETLVVEARLRPLDDPMRMNGCALVVLNPPAGIEADAASTADWVARNCGEPGGEARVWRLGGAG